MELLCSGCLIFVVGWFRYVFVWVKCVYLYKDYVFLLDFLKNYVFMVKIKNKILDLYCEIYEYGNFLQGYCYRVVYLKGKFFGLLCNVYCCYVIL